MSYFIPKTGRAYRCQGTIPMAELQILTAPPRLGYFGVPSLKSWPKRFTWNREGMNHEIRELPSAAMGRNRWKN
ncbi:MAG: hypothetical protein ACKV0T_04065 [Planctomycetales bacterium]